MTKLTITTAAFCLHARPYRESSLIVQFFSEQQGRVSAVVNGVKGRSKKNGVLLPLLQPFIPIHVSYTGKLDLKTLLSAESVAPPYLLKGQSLFAGLYVNELLIRLLPEHIDYPENYLLYQKVLAALQDEKNIEPPLRRFEKYFLEGLGYGIPFVEVDVIGQFIGPLKSTETYRFVTESGFIRCHASEVTAKNQIFFKGACLLKIMNDELDTSETLLQSKQLMRLVMVQRLNNKPLNSKMLFV